MTISQADYREYPKLLDPDDLWGQVRRTVHGKPLSEEQIALIVKAIRDAMQFCPEDYLMDLGCGNGALTRYFFQDCYFALGIDPSPYLIEIAQNRFTVPGKSSFILDDAAHYIINEKDPSRFTKVLCYGSFMYLDNSDSMYVLQGLRDRFTKVSKIFIGNLPDKNRASQFYPSDKDYSSELGDHNTLIGIWRSETELQNLAKNAGWDLVISNMPHNFYAAHYRFDAVLSKSL
jgi:SAM-dependent methyltransferase